MFYSWVKMKPFKLQYCFDAAVWRRRRRAKECILIFRNPTAATRLNNPRQTPRCQLWLNEWLVSSLVLSSPGEKQAALLCSVVNGSPSQKKQCFSVLVTLGYRQD